MYLNGQGISGRWRRLLKGNCPLCAMVAPGGGLCVHCHDQVVTPMRTGRRCPLCRVAVTSGHLAGPCVACQQLQPAFDRIVAAFDYCPPADRLVHRFKTARMLGDTPVLAGLLAEAVRRDWPDMPADTVLVPVPSSRAALIRRGFNPAAEIARFLARCLGQPCRPTLLQRYTEGQRQATRGRDGRMMGSAHLYRVNGCPVNACIAVVDDVLTTGSTLQAIAHQFRKAGARSVAGLVLARTPAD